MIHRKFTATLAAAAALALTGCGTTGDAIGDAVGTAAEPAAPAQTPAPTTPPPSLPGTSFDDMADEAFLTTLDEEGITLPDAAALDAAEIACETDDLFTTIDRVAAATGLAQDDAAFLVGAAVVTCGGGQ